MNALFIYDGTGKIHSIESGVEKVPDGITLIIGATPEEYDTVMMDVENATPHFYLDGEEVLPPEETIIGSGMSFDRHY